jgi:3-oxoacyl-[acyl-carrier protein] reductase
MKLKDRVAIVTGASRGIGRTIALELAKHGASVVVNYNASADAAQEVITAIEAVGQHTLAFQADVSKPNEVEAMVKAAIDQFGKIDILVNNAGIARDTMIMLMKEEDWDAVIDTNLKGAWNCSKAVAKAMIRKRYGRIINIASVSGIAGQAGNINYSASKAGMIGLTKSLAREVAGRQITVNALAVGLIDAGMSVQIPAAVRPQLDAMIPLGRWGTTEDVAYAVAFLASDEASYITGQVLNVDGGLVMS